MNKCVSYKNGFLSCTLQANIPQEEVLDPQEAKRRAIEAEEARLAAQRAHGTQVTPDTFLDWRKRFETELALQKARSAPTLRVAYRHFFMCWDSQLDSELKPDCPYDPNQRGSECANCGCPQPWLWLLCIQLMFQTDASTYSITELCL